MPPGVHLRAKFDQLVVPESEFRRDRGAVALLPLLQLFQQAVALRHHFLIAGERLAVAAVDLAEGDIDIAPPLTGAAGDKREVLRQEEDRPKVADQVHAAAGGAVHAGLLRVVQAISPQREQNLKRC